jgi:putative FmdB family regulatory protein
VLTYEYECYACGRRFELEQRITDPPLERCPSCEGAVRRLLAPAAGFVRGGAGGAGKHAEENGGCSFEQTGTTCCGRNARCGSPGCGSGSP